MIYSQIIFKYRCDFNRSAFEGKKQKEKRNIEFGLVFVIKYTSIFGNKKGILTLFIHVCYIINNFKKDSIILQVQVDCVMQVIICNLKNNHSLICNIFFTTRQVFLNFENTPKSTGYSWCNDCLAFTKTLNKLTFKQIIMYDDSSLCATLSGAHRKHWPKNEMITIALLWSFSVLMVVSFMFM